ncbi:concanavalin A-like lectin/glucanase domain-containing protein [Bisporella sp. PMI_857]|nr:concanavalin A-like lectin/glucanase domain-containing protein [Bisporella sp. PMI_857]
MKSLFLSLILATPTLAESHLQYRHPHQQSHHRRALSLDILESIKVKVGYKPTFFDSFRGEPGSLPSSSNWIFDLGTQYPGGAERWGNNEFETYTDSTSNVHITKANTLAITPRKDSKGAWTSARLETQRSDFVAAKGGKLYIESRIKLGNAPKSQQQGIWPAFWALGSEFRGNYTNWPGASEWDFLEVVSGDPKIYSTIHCGVAPGGPCNEYNGIGNGGVDFTFGEYHTIGFEVNRSVSTLTSYGTWREESLSWYMDGKKVHNVTGATVDDEEAWSKLAHEAHFLLLNVAVGGNWPGPPNNITTDGPKVGMEVDYVGVWNSH